MFRKFMVFHWKKKKIFFLKVWVRLSIIRSYLFYYCWFHRKILILFHIITPAFQVLCVCLFRSKRYLIICARRNYLAQFNIVIQLSNIHMILKLHDLLIRCLTVQYNFVWQYHEVLYKSNCTTLMHQYFK